MKKLLVLVFVCALVITAGAAWSSVWICQFTNGSGSSASITGPTTDAFTLGYAGYDGFYQWYWNTDTTGSSDGKTLEIKCLPEEERLNVHGRFQGGTSAAFAQNFSFATGWTMQGRLKIKGGGGDTKSTFGIRRGDPGCATITVNGANEIGLDDYGSQSTAYREEATAQGINYVGSYHIFTIGAKQQADGNLVADLWIDGIQQYADQLGQDGLYHFYVGAWSGNTGDVVRIGDQLITGDTELDWVYDWVAMRNDGIYGDWVAVPEPGSLLALGSGLVGLAGFAIRRRR